MFHPYRFTQLKLNIFSTIAFALFILFIIFSDTNAPIRLAASNDGRIIIIPQNHNNQLQTHKTSKKLMKITSDVITAKITNTKSDGSELLHSPDPTKFDSAIHNFFGNDNDCTVQVFMTWIAPARYFRERELSALESLFETNPESCLIILSRTLDSAEGAKILEPLINRGFRVKAITPNLRALLQNTPAENWLKDIKNGVKDPGEVPFAQNLSNLIRLAALYKYGGVYLGTDFIVLKDISGLRNSIGTQSIDVKGNWTRLNNAVLIFDKNHQLLYKFIQEFASTFDGNKWGHNGPDLVTRVIKRLDQREEFEFTIMPPGAFYPVYWRRAEVFFTRPRNGAQEKWVEAKVRQLSESSYGVHLWNRPCRRYKIEDGSIIGKLISSHCVICNGDRRIYPERAASA